uniref:Uncharacterized protein n=1 Tax=Buteo japonicus TaxID=224669 RepID=A0A8B9ZE95_9AVES
GCEGHTPASSSHSGNPDTGGGGLWAAPPTDPDLKDPPRAVGLPAPTASPFLREVKEKKEEVGSCQSEPPAKRVRLEDLGQDGESQEDAGAEKEPAERKRARGQNKNRPCMKPNHYEQSRLCPSVSQVGCGGPALRCSGRGNLGPWWALPAQGLHLFLSLGKHIEGGAAPGRIPSRVGIAGGCAGKTASVGWLGEGEVG